MDDSSKRKTKNFLYLVQGPLGLPQHLQVLNTSDSEIVVLSYLHNDISTNIYYPNSTWTQGRNALFKYGKQLERTGAYHFKYWVFMDDDVQLSADSLRSFERIVLEYEPAVAVPKYAGNRRVMSAPILPVYHFDALFNAFHRESLEWLMPYNGTFDTSSWWTSQLILIHKAGMWYQGHILEIEAMEVGNEKSRTYPRSKKFWKEIQQDFANSLPDPLKRCYQDKGHLGVNKTTKSLLWGKVTKKEATYAYPPNLELMRKLHSHYASYEDDLEHHCQLHTGPPI